MFDDIMKFKNYVEDLIKQGCVENIDDFSYIDYDNALNRIQNGPDRVSSEPWEEIFTKDELLKVEIMYACIVTGAIKSDLTSKLNYEKILKEHSYRTRSFFDN